MSELNDLLAKQILLMDKVPHIVSPSALMKLKACLKLLDTLLRYYNSVGCKPWRPAPLSPIVQQGLLKQLKDDLGTLEYIHRTNLGHDIDVNALGVLPRQYISGFGIVEESIEYMNSLTDGSTPEHRLEEHVDVLFFWLEQLAMSGSSTDQVLEEYHRKWAINIKRYEDSAKGNWEWDKRKGDAL